MRLQPMPCLEHADPLGDTPEAEMYLDAIGVACRPRIWPEVLLPRKRFGMGVQIRRRSRMSSSA